MAICQRAGRLRRPEAIDAIVGGTHTCHLQVHFSPNAVIRFFLNFIFKALGMSWSFKITDKILLLAEQQREKRKNGQNLHGKNCASGSAVHVRCAIWTCLCSMDSRWTSESNDANIESIHSQNGQLRGPKCSKPVFHPDSGKRAGN